MNIHTIDTAVAKRMAEAAAIRSASINGQMPDDEDGPAVTVLTDSSGAGRALATSGRGETSVASRTNASLISKSVSKLSPGSCVIRSLGTSVRCIGKGWSGRRSDSSRTASVKSSMDNR